MNEINTRWTITITSHQYKKKNVVSPCHEPCRDMIDSPLSSLFHRIFFSTVLCQASVFPPLTSLFVGVMPWKPGGFPRQYFQDGGWGLVHGGVDCATISHGRVGYKLQHLLYFICVYHNTDDCSVYGQRLLVYEYHHLVTDHNFMNCSMNLFNLQELIFFNTFEY